MGLKRVLVTGGAGYIGSHTAHLLLGRGYEVAIIDNLSRGHRHNVDSAKLYELDLGDTGAVTQALSESRSEAVIHFAAYALVGESMQMPELYFANNVCGSQSLLAAMRQAAVRHIVFSSTCAIYGMPHTSPIREDFPIGPVNPYGESKAMVEKMLFWHSRIHGLNSVSLRYFNASGADPSGRLGEEHDPETHLIPLVFRALRTGEPVTIFGDDYDTPDGTCIRDYIHVNDLAEAHILALEAMAQAPLCEQFNVGTGTGHSVREVIRAVEAVTGKQVPSRIGPRRQGDPPVLVASAEKIRQALGWEPRYPELHQIVETAWNFARQTTLA